MEEQVGAIQSGDEFVSIRLEKWLQQYGNRLSKKTDTYLIPATCLASCRMPVCGINVSRSTIWPYQRPRIPHCGIEHHISKTCSCELRGRCVHHPQEVRELILWSRGSPLSLGENNLYITSVLVVYCTYIPDIYCTRNVEREFKISYLLFERELTIPKKWQNL